MTIQWFPGHMAKARREIEEKMKLIDIVIELVDARIPQSSRNPMLDQVIKDKPRLLVLNKVDLADENVTRAWIRYFEQQGMNVISVNSKKGQGMKEIIQSSREMLQEKREKLVAKGVKNRPIRALIVGIPNSGKSTLINRMAKKNIAKTGNRPGVTTQQQWIKVGKDFELLDTPGILWPKFEDESVGLRLAATGAIKDQLLDFTDIATFLLTYYKKEYPDRLKERYDLKELPEDIVLLYEEIGKRRGCFIRKNEIDYEKVAELLIRETRNGQLGRLSFEKPE